MAERTVDAAVQDSAGVRIVENGPVDGLAPFRLAEAPVFRTGWASDDPQFGDIGTGAILRARRFAVADEQTLRIYVLDATGSLLGVTGARGQGPGEFEEISSVLESGDSLVVLDGSAGRVSVFHDGELVRDFALRRSGSIGHDLIGEIGDGSLILKPSSYLIDPSTPPGWVDGALLRVSRDGAEADTLRVLQFVEFDNQSRNPFRFFGLVAAANAHLAYARSDEAQVMWLSEEGRPVQIARWDPEPVAVGDSVWAVYSAAVRARAEYEESPELVNRALQDQREAAPDHLPFFRFLHLDDEGNAWMGEYSFLGEPPKSYSVVGRDGRWLGRVELPDRFRVLAISSGLVLGVERNELDLPAASVYRLERW